MALIADGGFGVRVFFVISGFLITTLLLNEKEKTGRISLSKFYKRRIARIFPAFYGYLLFIGILTALGILSIPLSHMTIAGLYLWNVSELFYGHSVADSSLISHTWSLAMEEQFYFLWPALVAFVPRSKLVPILWVIIVVSPFVRLLLFGCFPVLRESLMNFLTAADLILVGSLAAVYRVEPRPNFVQRLIAWRFTPWIVLVVQATVMPALLYLSPHKGAIKTLTVSLPSLTVALLILWLLERKDTVLHRVLNYPALVYVGVISYSLYLWQQPFTMGKDLFGLHVLTMMIVVVGATLFSYYLIERPARKFLRRRFGV